MHRIIESKKHPWRRLSAVLVAVGFAAAFVFTGLAGAGPALAQENDDETPVHAHDPTNIWAIARGGQLYDNWTAVLEQEAPGRNHPAYPAAGKKKGKSTWRCKECHGWDYMGKDGAYASGSHHTGIKGVRGVVGRDPAEIHKIIMNETHAYTAQMIPHSAMEKLALFLSRGQIDTDRYIDRASKVARGNPRRGASFFQTICAVCHGFDGTDINFKTEEKPEFVGTVGASNPWEALHKIRFGQPGVGMVALTVLDIEELIVILAFTQSLPTK